MADSLDGHNAAKHWFRAALSLLSGDLHDFADAALERPDAGKTDALVALVLGAETTHEWRDLPDGDAEVVREVLKAVLAEVAVDLRAEATRDSVMIDALENTARFVQRFHSAVAFESALTEHRGSMELVEAMRRAADLLANVTASWIGTNLGSRSWAEVAVQGELLRRIAGVEQDVRDAADRDAEFAERAQSASTERILRRSARLVEALGAEFRSETDGPEEFPLYVRRDIEDVVTSHVLSGMAKPLLIVAPAGYGKTSLAWGLHRSFNQATDRTAVLISATWLSTVAGIAEGWTIKDLVEGFGGLVARALRPVLFLDTADLLLHSDASIESTEDLLVGLAELGVPVVATVRPKEAESLDRAHERIALRAFSPAEMDAATDSLMRRYFPDHPVEDGTTLVQGARVRQFPVLEILQSPLLLRILFELAGDSLPSMEIDVTGLYRRYWQQRVAADVRTRTSGASADLSGAAERVGIVLLAEGSPDLGVDALIDISQRVVHPSPAIDMRTSVDALVGRGVLLIAADRHRFFHQTMFEFAAALGLAHRGGAVEARRLADHVMANPLDLFVGSVLEQLLIVLGDQRSAREAVSEIVGDLLETKESTAAQIALVAWAHQPLLKFDLSSALEDLSVEAIRRFLSTLPQVRGTAMEAIVDILRSVFESRPDECDHDVVRTMSRLARRDPASMARLFLDLDLAGHFTGRARTSLTNPSDLYNLLFTLADADAALVQRVTVRILEATPSGEGRARLLELVAESWRLLGSEEYLEELLEATSRAQAARDDVGGRTARAALGGLIERHLQLAGTTDAMRVAIAREVIGRVESTQHSVRLGAQLSALANHLIALGDDETEHLLELADVVFSAPALRGPPQIVGVLLAPVIASNGPAGRLTRDRVAKLLQDGLPVPHDREKLTEAQNWAIACRATLTDPRVPPALVAECVAELRDSQAWARLDMLLPVLAAAASGGAQVPREVIAAALAHSDFFDPATARRFMDDALELIPVDDTVAHLAVQLAIQSHVAGTIRTAGESERGRAALQDRAAELEELVQKLLSGDPQAQRNGVNLWKSLQDLDVLQPSFDQLVAGFEQASRPNDQARLIEMISRLARDDMEVAARALPIIKQYTRESVDSDLGRTGARRTTPPPLVDAAMSAYRMILANHATEEGWKPLKDLCFVGYGARPQQAHVKEVSTYIFRLLERGDVTKAAQRFVESAISINEAEFSPKQQRQASSKIHGHAVRIVNNGSADDLDVMFKQIGRFPKVLAEATIRSAMWSLPGRSVVMKAMQVGWLSGGFGDYAARKLSEIPRDGGFGTLPELLGPVG